MAGITPLSYQVSKANILVDQTGHARLADFGLLTVVSDPANLLSSSSYTQGGTARWMSPERFDPEQFGLRDGRPTKPSDCYALGMVIYETITGNLPFHKHADFAVIRKVLQGERPPRGAGLTKYLWGMLEQCWAPQPNNRPSIEVVLQCLETVSALQEPPSPGVDEETDEDSDESDSTTDSSGVPTSGTVTVEGSVATPSDLSYPVDHPTGSSSIGSGSSIAKSTHETYDDDPAPTLQHNFPPSHPPPQAYEPHVLLHQGFPTSSWHPDERTLPNNTHTPSPPRSVGDLWNHAGPSSFSRMDPSSVDRPSLVDQLQKLNAMAKKRQPRTPRDQPGPNKPGQPSQKSVGLTITPLRNGLGHSPHISEAPRNFSTDLPPGGIGTPFFLPQQKMRMIPLPMAGRAPSRAPEPSEPYSLFEGFL